MKTVVVNRTVTVGGRKTSVQLEHAFWRGLKEIAAGWYTAFPTGSRQSIPKAMTESFSRAIRLFVLNFYRHQMLAADHLLRSVAPLPSIVA